MGDPNIYYSNQRFIIYDRRDFLALRHRRIVGKLIGCDPKHPFQISTSGLPCLLSDYAAFVAFKYNLANFKKLSEKGNTIEHNEKQYTDMLNELKQKAKSDHREKRVAELKKRKIEASPENIGGFDGNKMKLTTLELPNYSFSPFRVDNMDPAEVKSLFQVMDQKTLLFQDLYQRGFYVTAGTKFGCDFIVYCGDPVIYHAQFAVRIARGKTDRSVDLTNISHGEINALHRLCHSANKILLLSVIDEHSSRISYWTLKPKDYLMPESDFTIFESIEPSSKNSMKHRIVDEDAADEASGSNKVEVFKF